MNFKKVFFALAGTALLLPIVACSSDDDPVTGGTGTTTTSVTITSPSTTTTSPRGLTLTGSDSGETLVESNFPDMVMVIFSNGSASVINGISGVTASVDGANVTLSSTASGVNYSVSGTTSNGSLTITSTSDFMLTLSGANITSTSGAPIKINSAVKTFVQLPSGFASTLADASGSSAGATLESAGSLFFSGSGSLAVAGRKGDAIKAAGNVRLTDATLEVTSAVNDGIEAGTRFVMDSGKLLITSSPTVSYSKGVSVLKGYLIVNAGEVTINTSASAGLANQYVSSTQANSDAYSTIINGGTISITSSSTSAEVEGIESNHGSVTINGGTLTLNVTDDAMNAESSVNINGGDIYAYVTGNDAIDSNGTMYITGGKTVAISTARAPETSMDSDQNTFSISGGILVALTPGAEPSSPSASTQAVALLGSGSANTLIHIQDTSSKEVITFLAPVAHANILVSTPNLAKSTTYNLYTGGSVASGTNFNGLYTSGTYSGGTLSRSFSTSSSAYTNVRTSTSH